MLNIIASGTQTVQPLVLPHTNKSILGRSERPVFGASVNFSVFRGIRAIRA